MKHKLLPILLLLLSINSYSQTQRYLEKKGFEEKEFSAGQDLKTLSISVNKASDKLFVINTETEGNTYKFTAYSKVLNLSTGRLDPFSKDGGFLTSLENEQMHEIDKAKTRYTEYNSFVPYLDKYILGHNYQKGKTIVLEKSDSSYHRAHEFDLFSAKFSLDGKILYGKKNVMENILLIYSPANWKLLKSIKLPFTPMDYCVLNNGNIVISQYNNGISILDPNGNLLFKLDNQEHTFQINDKEDKLVLANKTGGIMLYDISTGKLIAQDIGTYKNKNVGYSNKSIIAPSKIAGGKFYLFPYGNGIVNLFSTEKGKVIADLFFDGDDWAVIAKDGRVDGTSGAFEKLEWREYEGDKLISTSTLESSFNKYFTPRLLYSILHEELGTTVLPNVFDDIKTAPVLKLENVNGNSSTIADESISTYNSKQKNITTTFKVTKNSDKINEVRLYHNNKLVGVQKINPTSSYTFSISLNSVTGETNYIYAIASSTDGIDSEKCKLKINYATETLAKPKLYALVIGINKYQNPKYELNYALPDADAFKVQLEKNKSALFESIVTVKLYDSEATKANIIKAFTELSTVIKEQDVFVFYYAGHGTMSDNSSLSEFYIIPNDVTQVYGNEIMLNEKALSAGEIKKLSMNINAEKQIFILDACHSGGALSTVSTRGVAEERAIGQLARSTGTFWLTASGTDQYATEFAQLGHGAFTYSILEVLKGNDPSSMVDGTITVRELSSYTEQRVPELSQQYNGKPQYPASFSFGNDFPIMIINK